MDLGGWGCRTDAAEPYLVGFERVGASENRADIVCASDVVQYDFYARIGEFSVFFCRNPTEFYVK